MIGKENLRRQFERARGLGWIDFAVEAGGKFGIDPSRLLAIASRETNLDPRYLREAGDRGNGYGLTQIDIRSYREWVQSGKWRDPRECFLMAGEILRERLARFRSLEGKTDLRVTSMAGSSYSYDGRKFRNEEDLLRVAIASYNCGDWAYYHYSNSGNIDRGTSPGPSGRPDYSADVLERAATFRNLLETAPQVVPAPITPDIAPIPAIVPAEVPGVQEGTAPEPEIDLIADLKSVDVAKVEEKVAKVGAFRGLAKKALGSFISAFALIQQFYSNLNTTNKILFVLTLAALVVVVIHYGPILTRWAKIQYRKWKN